MDAWSTCNEANFHFLIGLSFLRSSILFLAICDEKALYMRNCGYVALTLHLHHANDIKYKDVKLQMVLLFFHATAPNQFNPSSVKVSSTPVRSLSVPSFNSRHTMAPAPQHPKQGVSSTGGNFFSPFSLCIMSLPFAPSSCASHKWPVQTSILDTESGASLIKRDVA